MNHSAVLLKGKKEMKAVDILQHYHYLNESDPCTNLHYLSSSENKAWKKFRPVRDLNPWPLQHQCSTLPTELTNQLGAGHYVSSISNHSLYSNPLFPLF